MGKEIDFNLNDQVNVRLTKRGKEIHKAEYGKYGMDAGYMAPEEDKDGWSKWHLWELMRIFGKHFNMGDVGSEHPFNPNIKILESL